MNSRIVDAIYVILFILALGLVIYGAAVDDGNVFIVGLVLDGIIFLLYVWHRRRQRLKEFSE